MTSFTYGNGSKVVKTGAGTIKITEPIPGIVYDGGVIQVVPDGSNAMLGLVELGEHADKVVIHVDDIASLEDGTYPLIPVGGLGTLTESDFEITVDNSEAEGSVKFNLDGSVSLTVTHGNVTYVWSPESGNTTITKTGLDWLKDGTGDNRRFGDLSAALFDGSESGSKELAVESSPKFGSVEIAAAGYVISGNPLDVRDNIIVDNASSLTLMTKETDASILVKNGGTVTLSAPQMPGVTIYYGPDSDDWDGDAVYNTEIASDGFSSMNVKNPTAPDNVSMSCKNVKIVGRFFVAAEEAGVWDFEGTYDDRIQFKVDGTQIFRGTTYSSTYNGNVNLAAGYHTFEIRAYDGGGGYGAYTRDYAVGAKRPNDEAYTAFDERNFNLGAGDYYDFAADIELEAGATLKFGTQNITINSLVMDATSVVTIDRVNVPAHTDFVTFVNAADAVAAQAKLQTNLGAAAEVSRNGNSLSIAWNAVFQGDTITDMNDANGWLSGVVPVGEDVVVLGSSTVGVLDEIHFDSITVQEGATLEVASESVFPPLTMASGTVLKIDDDTTIGSLTTTGEGTVEVFVADGKVLDLSEAELVLGADIVKTGPGTIYFGQAVPEEVTVSAGTVGVIVGVACSIDASKVMVKMGDGAFVPAAKYNGKCYSSDTYVGQGAWTVAENWIGQAVPSDGAHICVVGNLSLESEAAPASIYVASGAKFTVLTTCTLPSVDIDPEGELVIGDNNSKPNVTVTMAAAPKGAFVIENEAVKLAKFTMCTNSTYKLSGIGYFKNLALTMSGKLSATQVNVCNVYFGYAEYGETSYLSLLMDGLVIDNMTDNNSGWGSRHYFHPVAGGRVVCLGDAVIRNSSYVCTSWAHFNFSYIGVDNPVDEKINLVIDGTNFLLPYPGYFGGGVTVKCVNGGQISVPEATNHLNKNDSTIADECVIEIVGTNSMMSKRSQYNCYNFMSDTDGFTSLKLVDGGMFSGYRVTGNNKAVVSSDDGVWIIPKYRSGDLNNIDIANGFKAVDVVSGGKFTVVARDFGEAPYADWYDWDRDVKFYGKVTGAGDVEIKNETATNSVLVRIDRNDNTCTGSISADSKSTLAFVNGANWAGTVVAGNVVLTNLTDATAPAAVSFGSVRLVDDLELRFWKDAKGVITNDSLTLTDGFANEAGDAGIVKLVGQDAAELAEKELVNLGTFPQGAFNGIRVKCGTHNCTIVESEPDGQGMVTCSAKLARGLILFLK